MSKNNVLCLMAGGYPPEAIPQKHLLSIDGNYLFERVIAAVPTNKVWIIYNRINQGFWNDWYFKNKDTTFADKSISFFLDNQGGTKGTVKNPANWMSNGIPSLAMNFQIDNVIYSAIDRYFENFNFMDELLSKDNSYLIEKNQDGVYVFADLINVSIKNLLVSGLQPPGTMQDTVKLWTTRGTGFNIVKGSGVYLDCGTPDGLHKAESSYSLQTKVI